MSAEDHLGILKILDSYMKSMRISVWRLTKLKSSIFSFVSFVSNTCMLSELYFQDFCVVFSKVKLVG